MVGRRNDDGWPAERPLCEQNAECRFPLCGLPSSNPTPTKPPLKPLVQANEASRRILTLSKKLRLGVCSRALSEFCRGSRKQIATKLSAQNSASVKALTNCQIVDRLSRMQLGHAQDFCRLQNRALLGSVCDRTCQRQNSQHSEHRLHSLSEFCPEESEISFWSDFAETCRLQCCKLEKQNSAIECQNTVNLADLWLAECESQTAISMSE